MPCPPLQFSNAKTFIKCRDYISLYYLCVKKCTLVLATIMVTKANSSGSNWDPITKVTHYMDVKIKQVSVASLKFKIMMQACKDNKKWEFKEIQEHQQKMVALLTGDSGANIES